MSVTLEARDSCLLVRNTEARRGAITPALYQSIRAACERAGDDSVRSLLLTGGDFFCAGGDLQQLATRAELPLAERREKIELLHGTVRAMANCPVPIIAAVEGGAAGAGLSLVLACDLVVAAAGASFTAAYVKAGLTPDGGLTHALARLLPRQMAMQACLLGRPIAAETLAKHGAITELCAAGETLDTALALAQSLARGPAQAQSRIRQLLVEAQDASLAQQLEREADCMAEAQGGAEAAEGIRAFLQKRKPDFTT